MKLTAIFLQFIAIKTGKRGFLCCSDQRAVLRLLLCSIAPQTPFRAWTRRRCNAPKSCMQKRIWPCLISWNWPDLRAKTPFINMWWIEQKSDCILFEEGRRNDVHRYGYTISFVFFPTRRNLVTRKGFASVSARRRDQRALVPLWTFIPRLLGVNVHNMSILR